VCRLGGAQLGLRFCGRLSIGRASGNDLKLLGLGLSRYHAEVRALDQGFVVVDLGSSNGTFLEERQIEAHEPAPLRPGAVLRMGSLELELEETEVESHEGEGESHEGDPLAETGLSAPEGRLHLLLDTIAELHQHTDPQRVLPAIVDRVLRLTDAERGLLLMRGPDQLETWLARTRDGEELAQVEGVSRSVPLQVLHSGQTFCVTGAEAPGEASVSESMNDYDLQSVLCVPIRQHAEVCGVIYVDSHAETRDFGAQERVFLEALAAQCGVALERAAVRQAEADERARLQAENASLKGGQAPAPVVASDAMRAVLRQAERVATSDLTLLITGETGCGKEVLARHVHSLSVRRQRPFVVVDCGAIPGTLLESVLFGHLKGAFTGASSERKGLFAQADGGTLLLDEIGELPLELQPKLLRFLEEQTFLPVGAQERRKVDVRVIACTHRDLESMSGCGTFREDLFFRLSTFPLEIPPLRERADDVLPLARKLLADACHELGVPQLSGITAEACAALRRFSWPGNVRQLAHRMRRAAVVARPPFVTLVDLDLPGSSPNDSPAPLVPLRDARKRARQEAMDRFETEYLTTLLRRYQGHVQRAAEGAGVSRQMLQRLMSRHGISRKDFLPTAE
jgi:transcriptional regulator with GAF, ATPase, and Fis domain